ncbi:unnamed protein product [Amoebophrya sp. A25]|nr:unnamed protein product [Amoebophrya sp. A25]|eukprot:GSA25T00016366001.1
MDSLFQSVHLRTSDIFKLRSIVNSTQAVLYTTMPLSHEKRGQHYVPEAGEGEQNHH